MKRTLLYISIFLFFAFNIFSQDATNDQKNTLIGTVKKNPGGWYINMKYNNIKVEGNYYKNSPVDAMIDPWFIELNIDKFKYKGSILYKRPMFGANFYEFSNMKINKKDFTGQIKKDFIKTYRKDIFDCSIGEDDLSGYIEYSRKDLNKTINLKINDELNITGFYINKTIYNVDYSLRFGDKKISGTINNDRPMYKFKFKSADLTEDQIFLFLFFFMYLTIDEINSPN